MRVSTEEQSIALQEDAIMRFLNYKGISNIQIYKDEGLSGKDTNRPALKKLLEDCKQGKVELLVVWKLDRLSRSIKDLLGLMETLKEDNVKFASVMEQIDLTNPYGEMSMQILAVFAQFERNIISARTKAGMAIIKKTTGKHMGRKSLISQTIRDQVITLRKSGASYNQIARALSINRSLVVRIVYKSSTV